MRRTAVNTLDWWTANAAKRVGVSVGGPQDRGWRTAHWRLKGITAAESLVRLKQHVLVCWDWLRAFGLRHVCLNRVNSHPKSFLNDSGAFQSQTGTINTQTGHVRLAKWNRQREVCHSLMCFNLSLRMPASVRRSTRWKGFTKLSAIRWTHYKQ